MAEPKKPFYEGRLTMPPVGRQSAVRLARPKKWLDTAGLLMEVARDPRGAALMAPDLRVNGLGPCRVPER
jgi:hypothetical protein